MKRWKLIASVTLCLPVWWLSAKALSFHCTTLRSWFPSISYEGYFVWLVPPLFFIFFLHHIIYDLISLVTYKFGYDKTFDDAQIYPEDSRIPVSRLQRLFGYPLLLFVTGCFLAAWTLMVYCG
jgi:hypothetical protein